MNVLADGMAWAIVLLALFFVTLPWTGRAYLWLLSGFLQTPGSVGQP